MVKFFLQQNFEVCIFITGKLSLKREHHYSCPVWTSCKGMPL